MTNEKTRPPRGASGLFVAVLLLAGCVTVVAPTATPVPPTPTPPSSPGSLVVGGSGGVGVQSSRSFALPAGEYVAKWFVAGSYCRTALDLVPLPQLLPASPIARLQTTAGPMASPAEAGYVITVESGTYAIHAAAATCPWSVSLTRLTPSPTP